jgi:hypothetical protein
LKKTIRFGTNEASFVTIALDGTLVDFWLPELLYKNEQKLETLLFSFKKEMSRNLNGREACAICKLSAEGMLERKKTKKSSVFDVKLKPC